MTRKLTTQEIEQLSAYLDGQLPVREKMLLELRLRDDPDFQEELKALAHTHLALRSLPKRRAPRNFTLRPDRLPQRVGLRLFPAFRLASAIAGIVLAVVFAGDLLLGGMGSRAVPMVASSGQVVNPAEKMAGPTRVAQIITWGTPAGAPYNAEGPTALGRGGGMPENQAPVETAIPPQPAEATMPPASGPTLTPAVQDSNTAGHATPTPTETPTTEPTPTPTETETPAPQGTEGVISPQVIGQAPDNPILGVQPASPTEMPVSQPPAAAPKPQAAPHTLVRLVEAILGITLVAGALAAYLFYRRERL